MVPPLAAAATTWLLVRIVPSDDSTMPLPSSLPDWPLTWRRTTLGVTILATRSTAVLTALPVAVAVPPPLESPRDRPLVVLLESLDARPAPIPPPIVPASTATIARARIVRPRRGV